MRELHTLQGIRVSTERAVASGGARVGRAGLVVAGVFVWGCSSPGGERLGSTDTPLTGPSVDSGTIFADASTGDGGTPGAPSGFWNFDDCSAKSTVLADSSGNGANATHRSGRSCVAGVSGSAVSFKSAKDVVTIPDDPQFALSDRIAVAAWIKPTTVSGTHPIVVKESGSRAPFALTVHSGSVVFSVQLASGRTVTSSAPITANTWSHVGAFYDGQFVFLFLDGQQVGQVDSPGTLRDVARTAILVGESPSDQYFEGAIDNVWISTNPVSAGDIEALSCVPSPATIAVTQSPTGPVTAGTTVSYSVAVTDHDLGFCPAQSYFFALASVNSGGGVGPIGGDDAGGPVGEDAGVGPPPPPVGPASIPVTSSGDAGAPPAADAGSGVTEAPIGLQVSEGTPFSTPISPGQTFTFTATATATVDTDPGDYSLPFEIFSNTGTAIAGALDFDLAAPSGCFVTTGRELMVIDPSVVDDPVRTAFTAPATNPDTGVWTFARLMRDMAPTPAQAPAFVLGLFQSWLSDQTVNGFTVQARPAMQQLVLDSWPRASDGSLDLNQAPLRLLAIVNRIDTRDLAAGNAGEARFVFGVLDGFGNPQQFTLIVEYGLPAATEADVLGWANAWHALAANPFPSEAYNAALEALTLKFSGRGVAPNKPNGSALDQLRTNEIALSFQWELREFGISPTTGLLQEQTVALTPDLSFNGTQALADFVNQNEATILAATDVVPIQFEGAPFIGGSVFNDLVSWTAPGIANNEARFDLSSNTCNGCHGPDTATTFLHINPRFPGQAAALSGFLTGTTAFDAVTGAPRPLNDLARRNADLASLVCPAATASSAVKAQVHALGGVGQPTIAKGIRRTH